ncbi:MAG: ParB/RepB/Spo0J family partition protein [Candidatus Acidiferrales bacterium]
MSRKALGKGLSALLPDAPRGQSLPAAAVETLSPPLPSLPASELHELPLDLIDTSSFQPRSHFETQGLEELAQSIRSGGVVQPVVVRRVGERYELVTGERRLRAARIAKIGRIPTVIRTLSDEQALELALIENLQREDLSALEQARAFERLAAEFGLTQEEIAARTGKDRSTVANTLRLLRLPKDVQQLLEEGRITAGHARALLKLEHSAALQIVLARRMASRRVSVRQAEEMVERRLPDAKKERLRPAVDPNVRAAEEAMQHALGTKVRIHPRKGGGGRLEIAYYSLEDFDRIYDKLVPKGE